VRRLLLTGELAAQDPASNALLAAFARELPRWQLELVGSGSPAPAWRDDPTRINARSPFPLLDAVRGSEAVVLGDESLRGRAKASAHGLHVAALAKALGRRVVVFGAGAGGLRRRSDRMRAAAVVRWADLLVLRDPVAAAVLVEAGAPGPFRVGADPAWCALHRELPRQRRDEALVILDAREIADDPAAPGRLAAALDAIAAHGLRIRLAPWRIGSGREDDLGLARAIAGRLCAHARVLLPPTGLQEVGAEAASARVVLSFRTHGVIAAASTATPVVALGSDPEISSVARRLGQPSVALGSAPGELIAATLRAAAGPPPPPDAVAGERAAAREAFKLLRLLLDGRDSDEDHDLQALPLLPEPTVAIPSSNGSGPDHHAEQR
jgi:hypothetical protein